MSPFPTPLSEVQRLAALWSYDLANDAARRTLAQIVEALSTCYGARYASVSIVDAVTVRSVAVTGTSVDHVGRQAAFSSHILDEPTGTLVVTDATSDARFRDSHLVAGPTAIRSYAGVVLANAEGCVLGAVAVAHDQPLASADLPMVPLRRAAVQVMDLLERSRVTGATGADRRAGRDDPCFTHPVQSHSPPLWLGIRTETTEQLLFGRSAGRRIVAVAAGSPAYKSGLRAGEVVTEVDGQPARRRQDLTQAVARCAAGQVLRLRVSSCWSHRIVPVCLEAVPTQYEAWVPRFASAKVGGWGHVGAQ